MQSGNYLALKFNVPKEAIVKIEMSTGGTTTLDADRILVARVTATTQSITVTSINGQSTEKKEFKFSGLTLLAE